MTINGWLQIALLFGLILLTARPLGVFTANVLDGKTGKLDRVFGPVERAFYRLLGPAALREQDWRAYAAAVLFFSLVGFALLYAMQRLQAFLPLNPAGQSAVSPDLAFNTAISFVSNTNWQSYGGETTMSHLTQMLGLTVQNFVSAAAGIAVFAALARGFARSGSKTIGNFWVDVTRSTLYILLPLALVVAVALVALGVPQNLSGPVDATTLEGATQTISQGPVASQIAIKQLGTNGGGFFNANSAHPYENPNAWTNIITVWAIVSLALGIAVAFGRMIGREREGWVLLGVMVAFMAVATAITYWAEGGGTPLLNELGLVGGNMEGKETRFGTAMSSLWAVFTTGASNGSVNSMHDSYTPLGGMMPLIMIQLGEILPGGVGSGLYGIVLYAILAMFVAGLMVGRTPEYLGKKIEAREVKLTMLAVLITPVLILAFTAVSVNVAAGLAGPANPETHGYSEILYAFSSAGGNNGSAFAGLTANTPWYNTLLGITMLLTRFAIIVPVLAIAGFLAAKPRLAPSAGTFPTTGMLFAGLLSGVILIMGGLQFFPALALGPILEHLQMLAGHVAT
jgi:potassium-transporting ATPase potassium-binding subunit